MKFLSVLSIVGIATAAGNIFGNPVPAVSAHVYPGKYKCKRLGGLFSRNKATACIGPNNHVVVPNPVVPQLPCSNTCTGSGCTPCQAHHSVVNHVSYDQVIVKPVINRIPIVVPQPVIMPQHVVVPQPASSCRTVCSTPACTPCAPTIKVVPVVHKVIQPVIHKVVQPVIQTRYVAVPVVQKPVCSVVCTTQPCTPCHSVVSHAEATVVAAPAVAVSQAPVTTTVNEVPTQTATASADAVVAA